MIKGKMIVVEGLEGAGKSTAMKTITAYLQSQITSLVITREPGGTPLGEALRQLIKAKNDDQILDSRAELLLLYAARVQLLEQIIKPSLEQGKWVLADRFELSTFAYQGGGRGIDESIINHLSAMCLQGFQPDLIIFLDIKPEQGLERVKSRGQFDRIENESLLFFNKVYDSYHKIIKKMNNVIIIDASQSVDKVQESLLTQLKYYVAHHARP